MRKLPAYTIYLLIAGATSVLFTMMGFISAIYRVQTVGLNPLQLVLLGTALESTVFLFEVPTGVVADVVSRRLSVIIGYAIIGAGFMLEGTVPLFGTILLAQVIWGLGYTFTSGALDAWLADEIGEARLTHAYLQGSQVRRAGALAGIFISVILGRTQLGLPIFVAGLFYVVLALFLLIFMPETWGAPPQRPDRTRRQMASDTFRDGLRVVRGHSLLMLILGITVFMGLSSEGLDRLWEAHLLENFTFPVVGLLQEPVIWFGAMNVITLLASLALTEVIQRRMPAERIQALIMAQFTLNLIVIAGVVAFALTARFGVAVAAIMAVQVFRSANRPLFAAWINRQIRPRVRATVLSMNGQVDALGQIVGGPILGTLATIVSIPAAMVGVGLLLTPALLLYAVALRRVRRAMLAEPRPSAATRGAAARIRRWLTGRIR